MAFFRGQDYIYLNIILNTFLYYLRQLEDKLIIALNIYQLGIAIKLKDLLLDKAQIYLLILALAIGDVIILTTRGLKIEYREYFKRTSQLNQPNKIYQSIYYDYLLPLGITSLLVRYVNLNLFIINQAIYQRPSIQAM